MTLREVKYRLLTREGAWQNRLQLLLVTEKGKMCLVPHLIGPDEP